MPVPKTDALPLGYTPNGAPLDLEDGSKTLVKKSPHPGPLMTSKLDYDLRVACWFNEIWVGNQKVSNE